MSEQIKIKTDLDLIQLIGDWIIELDMKRAKFDRDSAERKKLNSCRDKLDASLRTLVREGISAETAEFRQHAAALEEVNKDLHGTFKKMDKIADTMETVVKLVGVVEKIVKLIPA
ncbi:MAG: hypothetical protein ACL93V_14620 [Candidatus Electrothrix sp. YB6]